MIPGSPATATLRRLFTELAESGRTGALHIGGTPGGALYLVAGRLTYAESPASPGIGDRLVTSGRLPAAAWRRAYADGAAGRRVGRLLVARGLLGRNELACRVVAAVCDATHALLQSDDAPVRFVPGEQHAFGVVARVELETARRPAPWCSGRPSGRRVSRVHHDAHSVRQPAASCPQDGPR